MEGIALTPGPILQVGTHNPPRTARTFEQYCQSLIQAVPYLGERETPLFRRESPDD